MQNIKSIFTKDVIEHYKANKDEITEELLENLRTHGNEGKQIALDILDLYQDEDGFYLDYKGTQIAYKRTPSLKGLNVKLNMSPIHKIELEKCQDIFYFMKNYIKIVTPKGVNFPDFRQYQIDFIKTIIPDKHESVVGLLPRQCCSGAATVKVINNNIEKELSFEELFNECKQES